MINITKIEMIGIKRRTEKKKRRTEKKKKEEKENDSPFYVVK